MILPIDYHPPGFPTTPTNECWAFAAESRPPVPAIAQFGPVGLGDRLATTFAVYSDPAIEPCYSPGEHVIRDDVGLGENGLDRRELTVPLAVDGSGTFSVEASPREIWT